jgi:hypothetical protein
MRVNEILVESYEPIVSPAYIQSLIDKIHTGHVTTDDEEMFNWIYSFDEYRLKPVNIADLSLTHSGINSEKVDKYVGKSNPPPIVIDGTNGWIIDGYHRANAAAKRGDETIQAYVGY